MSRSCYEFRFQLTVAVSAALAMALFAASGSIKAQEPPPPDERQADEGPDDSPPAFDRDHRRGGPRDERPRDRFRRGRDHRRPNGFGPQGDLPAEMIERIMEMLRDNFPEYHARLSKRREQNPMMFREALHRIVPIFKEYMILKDEKPELAAGIIEEFKNEKKLGELSRRYRDTAKDTPEQTAVAGEIETLVRRQVELHHQRMGYRLEQFEKRIQEQQAALERQRKHHEEANSKLDQNIARRIEEVKKGELRRPFEGPGPGGPQRFGDGPPGRRRGPWPDRDGPDNSPPHDESPSDEESD